MIELQTEERLLPGRAGRGRDGKKPLLIVCHVQEGMNDLATYFPTVDADSTFQCYRDGRLVRLLNDEDTAWTNGPWVEPDLSNPVIADLYRRGISTNDVSLTIEHQGFASQGFTDAQIAASARLVAYWCEKFSIPCDRLHVLAHSQLGPHKSCPGPLFPFDKLIEQASAILRQQAAPAPEDPNARYFKETSYWVVNTLPDGTRIGFYDYWKRIGLAQLGYPITPAQYSNEFGSIVQWFERGRLEYHPENTAAEYKVLEGLTGRECLELRARLAELTRAA